MKTHAKVVVIGGGINGCSVLYHLTKLGWNDVVLVEKDELTSGSTWLAAGNVVVFNGSRTGTRLHRYSIELYKRLEEETGQPTGWHTTGAIRLAQNKMRMDEYRHILSKDKMLKEDVHLLSADELKKLFPYMITDGLEGGLYHPDDGHTDPASTTQALAQGARAGGAEIYRFNRVTNLSRTKSGEWLVQTEKGDITCEIVVNAAGLWADRICKMVGIYLPIIPMEHHHILFEDCEELKALGAKEIPSLRDPDVPFYLRRELGGFLAGPYEAKCKSWKAHNVPWDWSQASLPTDLERIQDYMLELMERVPMLGETGMRHIVNGPITYTPDSNQLLGPVYGVPNFFSMAGCNFGITQAGGVGKYLAEWIVYGEPSIDMWSLDPRRFGSWTSKKFTLDKVHEAYRLQYQYQWPDLEREEGRMVKTTPIYDMQKERGAVFGARYGWERANWFAPEGVEPKDEYKFRRDTNYFEHVKNECLAARDNVGVYELSAFAKYDIYGPGAEKFLDYVTSGRLPKVGRVGYNFILNPSGKISDDLTIARLAEDRFYCVTAAASELAVLQHLEHCLPKDGGVRIDNVTERYGVIAVIGPNAKKVLEKVTETDLSNEAFPYMTWQNLHIGMAPARAQRMNFAGEYGWELHVKMEYMRTIYKNILEAGAEFNIKDIGMRAVLNSMRVEKGFLLAPEMSGEETPLQAGMDFFVNFDKDFVGKEALLKQKEEGIPSRLVMMEVQADHADCWGDEAVYNGDEIVGRTTSGGHGHRVGKSLALGYVKTELAEPGTELKVFLLGEMCPATVIKSPVYDPANKRVKGLE